MGEVVNVYPQLNTKVFGDDIKVHVWVERIES